MSNARKIADLALVTATPDELNLTDGSTAGTVVNSKAVVYGPAGEIAFNELVLDSDSTVSGDFTVSGAIKADTIIETMSTVVPTDDSIGGTVSKINANYDKAYNPAIAPFVGGGLSCISLVEDGTTLYLYKNGEGVYKSSMSTPFDTDTLGAWTGPVDLFSTVDTGIKSINWAPDGMSFLATSGSPFVHQFNVTTAWDMNSATLNHSYSGTPNGHTDIESADWENDGMVFVIWRRGVTACYRVAVTSAYDLSASPNATGGGISFEPTSVYGVLSGSFINDGAGICMVMTNGTVVSFDCNTVGTVEDGISNGQVGTSMVDYNLNVYTIVGDGLELWSTYSDILTIRYMSTPSYSITLDASVSNNFEVTLTGPSVVEFSNIPSGAYGSSLSITQSGGGYPVTWPTGTVWAEGGAPTLSSSDVDVFVLTTHDSGNTWYGFVGGYAFT